MAPKTSTRGRLNHSRFIFGSSLRWDDPFDILTGLFESSAGLAQLVEQLFRKQQVCGSSPQVGSDLD